MITTAQAKKCVTHHCACDCREYRNEKMEAALQEIQGITSYSIDHDAGIIDALCKKALAHE